MANRFVLPIVEVQSSIGGVGAGYKLNYYTAGGPSVRQDTFTDDALTGGNEHDNPVVADSAGRFAAIFMKDALYYVVYTDADDVQIWAEDNVRGVGSNADNLLDDTTRSVLASGGSANAYTLTVNQTFSAYANGQEFTFKANFGNTGACTLNVTPAGGSALGAKNIKKNHNQDPISGDIENGAWVKVKYDGTDFQMLSLTAQAGPIATQAEMESGASTAVTVTPGRQHFHPSAAKFWVAFNGQTGTLTASYNVTSVVRDSEGDYTVTIANDFSSANYAVVVTMEFAAGQAGVALVLNAGQAAGVIQIKTVSLAGADQDADVIHVVGFGDL